MFVVVQGRWVSICDSTLSSTSISKMRRAGKYATSTFAIISLLRSANVTPSKNKFDRSCKLQSVNGCDSTIVFVETERGYSTFNSTICSNASITIGSVTFLISTRHRYRWFFLWGSAFDVTASSMWTWQFKNYAENNIFRTLCPFFHYRQRHSVQCIEPKGTDISNGFINRLWQHRQYWFEVLQSQG